MKPSTLWGQATALAALCAGIAFTPAYREALVISVLLAAEWLYLFPRYTVALRTSPCSPGAGPDRRRQDRRVLLKVAVAVVLGMFAGTVGGSLHHIWFWHDDEALSTFARAFVAILWAVYASSLIDWYDVRPSIDGIVREPPWRTSGDAAWCGVTRWQRLHRSVAELLAYIAAIVALIALASAAFPLPQAAIVAIGTCAVGLVLQFMQGAISTLRHHVFDAPEPCIGDVLKDERGTFSYVLYVAASGIHVRDWDPARETWAAVRKIKDRTLDDQRYTRLKFQDCPGRDVAPDPAPHGAVLKRRRRLRASR